MGSKCYELSSHKPLQQSRTKMNNHDFAGCDDQFSMPRSTAVNFTSWHSMRSKSIYPKKCKFRCALKDTRRRDYVTNDNTADQQYRQCLHSVASSTWISRFTWFILQSGSMPHRKVSILCSASDCKTLLHPPYYFSLGRSQNSKLVTQHAGAAASDFLAQLPLSGAWLKNMERKTELPFQNSAWSSDWGFNRTFELEIKFASQKE